MHEIVIAWRRGEREYVSGLEAGIHIEHSEESTDQKACAGEQNQAERDFGSDQYRARQFAAHAGDACAALQRSTEVHTTCSECRR